MGLAGVTLWVCARSWHESHERAGALPGHRCDLRALLGGSMSEQHIIVGITGSRFGMSADQAERLGARFDSLAEGIIRGTVASVTVLHGDCFVVDEEADAMAHARGFVRACFPSNIPGMRAHTGAGAWGEPAHPWVRNRQIVNRCHWLIAMPCPRSRGTWMTWNFGKEASRKRTLLRTDKEPWNSWDHEQ